jgi:RNA polymerase sigma-70 factor (ECF subfamily)
VILQLLDELSEPLAQALALHYLLGYTVEEIAASLSLSPHTVWSRLRLGKNALRRKLERRSRLLETVRSPD